MNGDDKDDVKSICYINERVDETTLKNREREGFVTRWCVTQDLKNSDGFLFVFIFWASEIDAGFVFYVGSACAFYVDAIKRWLELRRGYLDFCVCNYVHYCCLVGEIVCE